LPCHLLKIALIHATATPLPQMGLLVGFTNPARQGKCPYTIKIYILIMPPLACLLGEFSPKPPVQNPVGFAPKSPRSARSATTSYRLR